MARSGYVAWWAATLLSGSRLVLAGIFVLLALDDAAMMQRLSMAVLLVLVGTDFIDGPVARRWKVTSTFGFVLDGVGDRALYLGCLLVMSNRLNFPVILAYLWVLRDIVLYAARSIVPNWKNLHKETRWRAKLHAGMLRALFILYFVPWYSHLFDVESGRFGDRAIYVLPLLSWVVTIISYATLWTILQGYFALGSDYLPENSENKRYERGKPLQPVDR